ncbi:MAG: hypothetical protein ACRDI1_09290 [Actinomycetota bacterium]
MDNARERLLAVLFGGSGTVAGILLYQAIPDLVRFEFLEVRLPNAIWFAVVMFLIGALGGRLGHWAFLHVAKGPIEGRALVVGATTGLAIAVFGWTTTYVASGQLVPLKPFPGSDDLLRSWLPNALLAGPMGGVIVSALVVRRLRRITGRREPLEDGYLE